MKVESEGIGRRRRWSAASLLALVPIVAAGACALTALAPQMSHETFFNLVVPSLLMPPAAALIVTLLDRRSRRSPGTLEVIDGRVVLSKNGRTESIAVSDFASGWFVPAEGRLELRRKNGSGLSARLTAQDANAVLHAVGLDATQRALTLPLRGTIGTPVRALLGFMVGGIPSGITAVLLGRVLAPDNPLLSIALWFAFSVGIMVATAKWLGAPKVVVGADGLTVIHALKRRFIPFHEITSVARELSYYQGPEGAVFSGLLVRLRGGGAVRLPLVGQSEASITTLIARIEAAMQAPPAASVPASLELLARNGRSLADWRRDIEAVIRAPESYRQVRLSREDLLAALGDSKAPAEHRVTAALALSILGDDDASARIRVAADATASAPVRVALQQLADGDVDEDALVAAIDEDAKARSVG